MEIKRQQILDLAELVRVELSEAKADSFRSDLNKTLHFFENLKEVDTSDIPPTARVFEGDSELRDDTVVASLRTDEIAAMAGDAMDPEESVFTLQGVFDSLNR